MGRAFRGLGVRRSGSLFVDAREDSATFGNVYLAYRDVVLRYFARRMLDPEHAFDLMAETFAELYEKRATFRGGTEEQGRAWMWAIAQAQLARWRREGEVERRHLERLGVPVPSLGPHEYERIEELADLARFKPILDEALGELTERQQFVLREHVMAERAYVDLAADLDTTEVAIRMTVSRALRQLSRVLERRAVLEHDGAEQIASP
jgi:RNA polymerase sigma factor (sigma-70 family)